MKLVIQYLQEIQLGKAILWCYLIWYLLVVGFYFDPSPKIWMNSMGISAVIGTGLMFSVSSHSNAPKDFWQIFRLYLMPFCVSSFSALIKEQNFIVFISPKIEETAVLILSCLLFLATVLVVKSFKHTAL